MRQHKRAFTVDKRRTCLRLLAGISRGRLLLCLPFRPTRRARAGVYVHRDVSTCDSRGRRLRYRSHVSSLFCYQLHRHLFCLLHFLGKIHHTLDTQGLRQEFAHLLSAEVGLALRELDFVHRMFEFLDGAVQLLKREPRVPNRLRPVQVLHAEVLEYPTRIFVQTLLTVRTRIQQNARAYMVVSGLHQYIGVGCPLEVAVLVVLRRVLPEYEFVLREI